MPDKKVYLSDINVNHISILTGDHKPANKQKVVIKSEEPQYKLTIKEEIEGLVYGTVMVVEDADTYGEHISREDVKKAAHSTMKAGKLRIIDTNHDSVDNTEVAIVESYLEKDSGDWNIVVDISGHDELMKEAKEGNLTGLSFAGMVNVVEKQEEVTKEEFWEMTAYKQIEALQDSMRWDLSYPGENYLDEYLDHFDKVTQAHRKVVEFIIENEKGNTEKKKGFFEKMKSWFEPKDILNKEDEDMKIEDMPIEDLTAELERRKAAESPEIEPNIAEPTEAEKAAKLKEDKERIAKEKAEAPISRAEHNEEIKTLTEKFEKKFQDMAESVATRKTSERDLSGIDMNDHKVVFADPELMKRKKAEDPAGYEVLKRRSQGR